MSVSEVQAGRSTGAGHDTVTSGEASTSKVEEQDSFSPQISVTVKVNERLTPSQFEFAGSAGMEAILLVALHPPENVNPATQLL